MGSKKVEEKLQTLIHAFYEQKELSAKDIQNLLVCNRASTYNYIERLKERGFELESTTRNKTATIHSSQKIRLLLLFTTYRYPRKFYENTMLSRTSSANTTLRNC